MAGLAEAASQFAADARAENTRRAYAADWADFAAWCTAAGVVSLPAEPATVANYLTARSAELRVSTLARRRAAIRDKHLEASLQAPESGELRRVWSGIRRTLARAPSKKKALIGADVARVVAALPDGLVGMRDRALLLIGFAAALRRSELAAIELDGPGAAGRVRVVFMAEGLEVLLDRSKGDQEGRGAAVGVPFTGTALCPVRALEAWLKAAGIRSGAVFRRVDRWGKVGKAAIAPATVAHVVKSSCSRVGLNPTVFAGHSLRRGFLTTAHRAGAAPVELQRHARHKRPETTMGYIEEAGRIESSLAGKVGL